MKTLTKNITVDAAIKLVKPFIGSLPNTDKDLSSIKKVLKTALITPEYVIATDSHRLIRITHNEVLTENSLHHYKPYTKDKTAADYPKIERLFPDLAYAKNVFTINVAEFLEAHEAGYVVAHGNAEVKKRDSFVIKLSGNILQVVPTVERDFNQAGYKYTLDDGAPEEVSVHYNSKYMVDCMKVLQKLKHKEATIYYYGPHRPFLITAEDVDMILLPVKMN